MVWDETQTTGTDITASEWNTMVDFIKGGAGPFVTVGTASGADYVCDGVADEVQIQAACDRANASGGGIIFLKEGTYNLTDEVTLTSYSNILLRGEGDSTIIKLNSETPHMFQFYTCNKIKIENIAFDGNKANITSTSNHIFRIEDCDNFTIVNNRFENAPNHAILGATTASDNVIIAHNMFNDNDGSAVDISAGGNRWIVSDNIIGSSSLDGVQWNSTANEFIVSNNTITNCSRYGIFPAATEASTNCIIKGNTISGAGAIGIYVAKNNKMLIAGNVIYSCTQDGIRLENSSDCVINGNIIYNNNQINGTNHGIRLKADAGASCVDNIISNNRIFDNQASPTQDNGIVEVNNGGTINRNLILGNHCRTNLSTAIVTVGENTQVSHNITS